MDHTRLKLRGAAGAAYACLIATMFGCSSDDTTIIEMIDAGCTTPDSAASGSSGSTTGSSGSVTGSSGTATGTAGTATGTAGTATGTTGASGSSMDAGPVIDSAIADTSTHDVVTTPDTGSTVDTGAPDATLTRPASPNICALLDAIWSPIVRADANSWPNEIVNGATSGEQSGFDGYTNLIFEDCNVSYYFNNTNDLSAWGNRVVPFTLQVFGCPDSATDAGNRFELVPPDLYGQPATIADLDRLRAWFVEATVQAVANEAITTTYSQGPLLTPDQIDEIDALVQYEEMTYPDIVQSSTFSHSVCGDGG